MERSASELSGPNPAEAAGGELNQITCFVRRSAACPEPKKSARPTTVSRFFSATPGRRPGQNGLVNCGVDGLCIQHRPAEVPAIMQNNVFGSIRRRRASGLLGVACDAISRSPLGGRGGGEAPFYTLLAASGPSAARERRRKGELFPYPPKWGEVLLPLKNGGRGYYLIIGHYVVIGCNVNHAKDQRRTDPQCQD